MITSDQLTTRKITKGFLVVLLLSLFTLPLQAQRFLIGLKGGANFTQASVSNSFSAFQYTAPPAEDLSEKSYKSIFKNTAGSHFGLAASFELNRILGISFEPAYAQYHFGYDNSYTWESTELLEQVVSVSYEHEHRISYVELPLFIRFTAGSGKIAPYVQGGGFINLVHNASKSASATVTDQAGGSTEALTGDNNDVAIDHLMNRYYYGLAGSAGLAFNLPYFRVALDFSYRRGLNTITDKDARFTDMRSSNISFDVMDDIQLNNMQFSLVIHFPVNFGMGAGGSGKKNTRYVVPYDLRRFKEEGSRRKKRN